MSLLGRPLKLVLALALSVGGVSQGAPRKAPSPRQVWTNPIVPQRADPHVFLHTDGYYYMWR